jgi:hypothetical protein
MILTNTENENDIKNKNKNFTREDVEGLGNLVNLVDSDDNKLDMFCYAKCSPEDNELLKQCRGVIFKGSTLILKAFPFTTEYNHTETKNIKEVFANLNDWTFFESHEGTLVRVFYFENKWYISTHRKLDAFRSKWASRESFGQYFKNALLSEEENNNIFKNSLPTGKDDILERFQETLDKTKQYMFLIRNSNENRIVSDAPSRPTVYHVGTFINGELNLKENINIPFPKSLTFNNVDDILDFMKNVYYTETQGVIAFDISNNRQVKVVHKDYQTLFNARGNEPSIKFRYLQVRQTKVQDMLFHLYPEMANVFDDYENCLYNISNNIYKAYVDRFIKKQYVTVDKEEFNVIKECHSWHLSDRTCNRVNINKIVDVLNKQSPTSLNRMIHRFKLVQNSQTLNDEKKDQVKNVKFFKKNNQSDVYPKNS